MIGRAAQGRPWIFREIAHELATGQPATPPATLQVRDWLVEHLHEHHALYGERAGVRSARKHIGWYVQGLPAAGEFRARMNLIETAAEQLRAVSGYFDRLADMFPDLPVPRQAASELPHQ
jgi:tRNA-dihydrouridine synthase B